MTHRTLTVREYARLGTDCVVDTLDQAQVSGSEFDGLCEMAARWRGQAGAHILQVQSSRWLKLDNHVGVLETPCGLRLEILPKHVDGVDRHTVRQSRLLLRRMLEAAMNLPPREADEADVQLFDHPLLEWVMHRFLQGLDHVVKRGMRRDYLRVEEERPFLRGQLDAVKQMRAAPGRGHLFNVRHDIFSVDRPENRLLKSALKVVSATSREAENWRLANELLHLLDEVPASSDIPADFRAWRRDRLMAHYQPARPWCELVLGEQMPLALAGEARGISLLFPMEQLFERYVGTALRATLPLPFKLIEQSSRHWFCDQAGTGIFQLRPDFLIEGPGFAMLLDAKWKRLDGTNRRQNYGIDQADFYQLFGYGHKYLGGKGEMALIYPRTTQFLVPLVPFHFSADLRLQVLPFDLERAVLHWQCPFAVGPNVSTV